MHVPLKELVDDPDKRICSCHHHAPRRAGLLGDPYGARHPTVAPGFEKQIAARQEVGCTGNGTPGRWIHIQPQSPRRGQVDGRENRTARHHCCRSSRSQNEWLITRSGIGKDTCLQRWWEHDGSERLHHVATAVLVKQQVARLGLVGVTQCDADDLLVRHSSGHAAEHLHDCPDDIEEILDIRDRRDLPRDLDRLARLVDVLLFARRDDRLRVQVQDLQRHGHVGTLTKRTSHVALWTQTGRLTVTFHTAERLLGSSFVPPEVEFTTFVLVERTYPMWSSINVVVDATSSGSVRPSSELADSSGITIVTVDGVLLSIASCSASIRAGSR